MKQVFDSAADLRDAPDVGSRLRPKDAATLIVVRHDAAEPRVLMGRRAAGHVFMASKWVFPGGRVSRGDWNGPAATELRADVAAQVDSGAARRRARALGLAAIRETLEETGLFLAKPVAAQPATGVWRRFIDAGVAADLAALSYVARAITPPGRPRRFDARFFMADASALTALEPDGGDRELDEIAWIAMSQTKDLDLPQITRFVLSEVEARFIEPERSVSYVRMVRGRHTVERL